VNHGVFQTPRCISISWSTELSTICLSNYTNVDQMHIPPAFPSEDMFDCLLNTFDLGYRRITTRPDQAKTVIWSTSFDSHCYLWSHSGQDKAQWEILITDSKRWESVQQMIRGTSCSVWFGRENDIDPQTRTRQNVSGYWNKPISPRRTN